MNRVHDDIEEALGKLRGVISTAVRREQLRDQLTGLPNDAALTELLQTEIEDGREFWIAFVEIDFFKRINDTYGYEHADTLLKTVAKHLNNCKDYLPHEVVAYRAHGDEYFLVGRLGAHRLDESAVNDALDQVRTSIKRVQIAAPGNPKPMSCTVSVGWATSADGRGDSHNLSARSIRLLLERAVAHAKRQGRDQVVRYDKSMTATSIEDIRGSCLSCKTSFTAVIPSESARRDALFCPNCGASCGERPLRATAEATQSQPTVDA